MHDDPIAVQFDAADMANICAEAADEESGTLSENWSRRDDRRH
jgi:hypothetical protein